MATPPIEVSPSLSTEHALERVRRGSAAALLATWSLASARVAALEPPRQERLELTLERVALVPARLNVTTDVAIPLRPDEPADPDVSDLVADLEARFEALLADLKADADVQAWLATVSEPRAVFDPLGANLRGRLLLVGHDAGGAHVSRLFPA